MLLDLSFNKSVALEAGLLWEKAVSGSPTEPWGIFSVFEIKQEQKTPVKKPNAEVL